MKFDEVNIVTAQQFFVIVIFDFIFEKQSHIYIVLI